ncbi:hypothetical protein CI791_05810 [Leuconostoc lactis]|uniref:hypothetical protein n=1 Tax=Leuconostoc lactis TaxID=1246 RepID=UPI000BAB76E0|nr:hypothetical protein [Leuconostoc lactis]PAV32781.1 hypothetical protein CI791_05810 [Leuconostoc lactis]
MRIERIIKDFGYVISSNLLNLIISTLVILVVPKIVGVQEYGYWQVFMFYSSYLGLLPLGWLDGIYLRYGGEKYSNLNKPLFFSQFVMLMALQVAFAIIIMIIGLNIKNYYYSFITNALAIYLLILIAQSFFKFILQITNRLKEFSTIVILSNLIYIIIVIVQLVRGIYDIKVLIFAYIIGNFTAMIYGGLILKDIFIHGFKDFHWTWREAKLNISVGVNLLTSNIASMLIIGVIRIGIQNGWGVSTFGKISLTLSISNLLMIFINSISLVLFPKFRRIKREKLTGLYVTIRDLLMPITFVGILLYFPISYFIPIWLPKYQSALIYMSLLFPMIIYQSKFEILSSTFLKVFRMEKQLLLINLMTLIFSIVMTLFTVFYLRSITMTVFSIILVLAIRSIFAELYVKRKLELQPTFDLLIESTMVSLFMIFTWYFARFEAFCLYSILLFIYLFFKKKRILLAIRITKKM